MTAACSVIIPTVNRPQLLRRAVVSATNQQNVNVDIIVVVDGYETDRGGVSSIEDLVNRGQVRLAWTGRPIGDAGASARNLGVRLAQHGFVAFLDDDDEWLPGKLAAQLAVARNAKNVCVACKLEYQSDDFSAVWPRRFPGAEEPVAEYLFVRSAPGEGFMPTSVLLVSRETALAVPFRPGIAIHADFQWLMDLEKHGCRFLGVHETLAVMYAPRQRSSVSENSSWNSSLAWALQAKESLGPRAFSAFVLTEVARRVGRGKYRFQGVTACIAVSLAGRPRLRDLASTVSRLLPRRLASSMRRVNIQRSGTW